MISIQGIDNVLFPSIDSLKPDNLLSGSPKSVEVAISSDGPVSIPEKGGERQATGYEDEEDVLPTTSFSSSSNGIDSWKSLKRLTEFLVTNF